MLLLKTTRAEKYSERRGDLTQGGGERVYFKFVGAAGPIAIRAGYFKRIIFNFHQMSLHG